MSLSVHVRDICQRFNQERSNLSLVGNYPSNPLKISQTYDLLAILCGLSKFDFDHIGFISTSIMSNVDNYYPILDEKITKALSLEIANKIELKDQFYCSQLASSFAHYGFYWDGIKIRHPNQLLVMLEELYRDEQEAWENLDDILALIDSLEFAMGKKKKFRDGKTYLILHWCYAILKVHEFEIHKRCNDFKILAKREALLSVYQPYIDIAVTNAEKWFNYAIESNEPAALELKQRLENMILSESCHERSHPFIVKNPDFFSYDFHKYQDSNPFNVYRNYPKIGPLDSEGQFDLNPDPFEKLLNNIHLKSNSDLEFATTAYLYRLFKRDMLGLTYGEYNELGFDNSYNVLYSDSFLSRLMEDYPSLTKSDLYFAELEAQKQFNDMFRHYLKCGGFENYKIAELNSQIVEQI